jgi:hypothetical protein
MVLGLLLGGAVGLAILLHMSLPGVSWLVAVGLAKLSLVAAGGLIAAGAFVQRLANRRDDAARLSSGSDSQDRPSQGPRRRGPL